MLQADVKKFQRFFVWVSRAFPLLFSTFNIIFFFTSSFAEHRIRSVFIMHIFERKKCVDFWSHVQCTVCTHWRLVAIWQIENGVKRMNTVQNWKNDWEKRKTFRKITTTECHLAFFLFSALSLLNKPLPKTN